MHAVDVGLAHVHCSLRSQIRLSQKQGHETIRQGYELIPLHQESADLLDEIRRRVVELLALSTALQRNMQKSQISAFDTFSS
jgi:hypothetical protein